MRVATFSKIHLSAVFFIFTLLLVSPSGVFSQEQTLTGHENFSIPLSIASQIAKNYQIGTAPGDVWAKYFSKDALATVLAQPDCVGIRIYYAKYLNGSPALVIVGVDAKDNDILNGTLLDTGYPCPPVCDTVRTLGH